MAMPAASANCACKLRKESLETDHVRKNTIQFISSQKFFHIYYIGFKEFCGCHLPIAKAIYLLKKLILIQYFNNVTGRVKNIIIILYL
jgi:hypothetical protein